MIVNAEQTIFCRHWLRVGLLDSCAQLYVIDTDPMEISYGAAQGAGDNIKALYGNVIVVTYSLHCVCSFHLMIILIVNNVSQWKLNVFV